MFREHSVIKKKLFTARAEKFVFSQWVVLHNFHHKKSGINEYYRKFVSLNRSAVLGRDSCTVQTASSMGIIFVDLFCCSATMYPPPPSNMYTCTAHPFQWVPSVVVFIHAVKMISHLCIQPTTRISVQLIFTLFSWFIWKCNWKVVVDLGH